MGRLGPHDRLAVAARDHEQTLADRRCAVVASAQLALLDQVEGKRVADAVAPATRFDVRNGDWTALRRVLESTTYDGASHLGAVRYDGQSEEALWFSDGLATYGAPWRLAFPVPVFAINSSTSSDPAALQALADASGGRSIDLGNLTDRAAADELLTRTSQLDGPDAVSATGGRDVVVQ